MTAVAFAQPQREAARRADALAIRPWQSSDLALLPGADARLSPASLSARFFTGTSHLPTTYLRHIAAATPNRWDAVVALDAGALVGWAEYGRQRGDPDAAELGVIVVDDWQHRGVGTRLVRALVPRAIRAGVRTLAADVQQSNHAAQQALRAVFGEMPVVECEGGIIRYAVPLLRPLELAGDLHDR